VTARLRTFAARVLSRSRSRTRRGRRYRSAAGVVLLGFAVLAAPAEAQAPRPPAVPRVPGPPRFDLTVGGGLLGGLSLGQSDANLRANATTAQNFALFSTDTQLRPAPAASLRVGAILTSRFAVEGQMLLARATLRTTVSDDSESAPDVTISETLTEMFFAGGVRVRLDDLRPPNRLRPFVSAAVGVVRRADDQSVSEQNLFMSVGGGVLYAIGGRPGVAPRQGVRADVQALLTRRPFRQDDDLSPRFAVTGGFFVTF
jgi:hypothetical protein